MGPFPKVTNRSLPLNISNYLDETFGEDNCLEWLYLEDCPDKAITVETIIFDEDYSFNIAADEGNGIEEEDESFDRLGAGKGGIVDVKTSNGREIAIDVMEDIVTKVVNAGQDIVTAILEERVEEVFLGSVIVA